MVHYNDRSESEFVSWCCCAFGMVMFCALIIDTALYSNHIDGNYTDHAS